MLKESKPTEIIENLWTEAFFKQPKGLSEVLLLLGQRGINPATSTISNALRLSPFLKRLGKKGNYKYIQKISFESTITLDTSKKTSKSELEQLFNSRKLHPQVKKVSKGLFIDKYYSQAIFETCKQLNKKVQQVASLSTDGRPLMENAFSARNPKIQLNQLTTQSDKDEQEGYMYLFVGTMVGIRNPKGHEIINLKDPYKALEYLGFLSMLFRRIDERFISNTTPAP